MSRYTHEDRQHLKQLAEMIQRKNAELEQVKAARAEPGARWVGSRRSNWRTPQMRVVRWVPPGHRLTQYGTTDKPFREEPRFDTPIVEVEVSMILGHREVQEVAMLLTGKPAKPTATVRYFRTADLYLAGYLVAHTPSERIPNHVSVHYRTPHDVHHCEDAMATWAEEGRVTLESLAIPAGEAT